MFKVALIFLMMLLLAGQGYALSSQKVKPKTISHQLKKDSARIIVHQFDSTAIKKYHSDPAFNYSEEKTDLSWWDRFWQWVWEIWDRFWQWVAHILQRL